MSAATRLPTVLVVLLAGAGAASAGWVTIRNETGKTITVQEITVVNGQVRRGRATNLLAGESLREFVPAPATKRLDVFDAHNPNEAAWSGGLACREERQTFSVTAAGGKFAVGPAAAAPKK